MTSRSDPVVAERLRRRAEALISMHPQKGRGAIGPFCDRDGHWGYGQFAEDALEAADQLTVLSQRVVTVEAALRAALDMVVDATRDGGYSVSEFNDLRSTLPPPPATNGETK